MSERRAPPPHPLLLKTTRTLLVAGVLLAIPYTSPRLARFRVAEVPWAPPPASDSPEPQKLVDIPPPVATVGEQKLGATSNEATVSNSLPDKGDIVDEGELAKKLGSLAIQDKTGHALDAYYAALAKTIAKEPGAITRILHYGDSVVAGDLVSGTMRRLMQAKFGDSGHGFILTANPWEWYFHNDVSHSAGEGWSMTRITGPFASDGAYGLGGVSFQTTGVASAWFGTKYQGDYGRNVSRFDVYYMAQPGGGTVQLMVPGRPAERLTTRAAKKESRVYSVSVPDGQGQMSVKTLGDGEVRLFGVALERDMPGVVYDSLGANGARIRLWDTMSDENWTEQFALRKPSLIVLQYGANESEEGDLPAAPYEAALDRVITRIKAASPGTSLLILSPLDRAERTTGGKFQTKKVIWKLVEIQQRVAEKQGIAFWNTFEAMGGEGSMARWVRARPQLGGADYTHPTPAGGHAIGKLLFSAMKAGYSAYASSHKDARKLPEDAASP